MSNVRVFVAWLTLVVAGCAHASSNARPQGSPAATLPITTSKYPAFGHAADFSWVAGKLIRTLPAGECTYLMFSTGAGGQWGGRIALVGAPNLLDAFPDGDMVVVTGSLGSTSLDACGKPAVTVKTIEEH